MKKICNLLYISLLSFSTFAQKAGEQPYLVKTFKASDVHNVKVETSGGSISVQGQTGDEAKVEVYIHGNNMGGQLLDKSEIERRLKDYTLTISNANNQLFMKAEPKVKNNWNNGLSISFKVYCPKNVSSQVNTSGGSINLQGISGKITGNTSGGSIRVNDCHNAIDLNTSGGSITAENSDGNINLETSGGSLNFEQLSGKIHGTTSGGSVNAKNIKGEFITSTSGGGIHLSGIAASLDASTSGGGIDVEMTSLGKYLKLETSAGGIRVKMPMNQGMDLDIEADKISIPSMSNFSGSQETDHVKGKVNGGGIQVKMESSSGNIRIN